ncbi:MAG: 2-octaprenyl-6-methoxyphenyl hydroxylase [Xanthomonadales bacterium]|nr:2-octaprenyl-6-methoxyphenyl hydroxylase [Xanthomonadales bacterium]
MQERFDIVIVGGGLVGASLAIALDASRHRVVLVEAALPRVEAQPSHDERNLALARVTIDGLAALGVWKHAAAAATPIRRIHVSRRGDFGSVRLDCAALGLAEFGVVLPARELGRALLARLDECTRLVRLAPAELVGLDARADAVHMHLRTPEGERALSTRLLVGADGTTSFVRSALGIGTDETDYAQSAIVTTLACERPLDGQAWERFTDSGPVAVLPRGGHRAGLVLSVPSADAARIAALDDEAFIAFVHERFGWRAGRFSRPGARRPYPLRRTLAQALVAGRAVLVGNAAQTVHPLGAQGFNLGLRDALSLAELVEPASDPGAADVLAAYVARRQPDRNATTAFSDDLVRLMGNDTLPLRGLRSLGFAALALSDDLKRRVALRGMGFRGDVSARALAR